MNKQARKAARKEPRKQTSGLKLKTTERAKQARVKLGKKNKREKEKMLKKKLNKKKSEESDRARKEGG